jgi:cyanate permease
VRLDFRFRYALYAAFSTLFISGALWLAADSLKDAPDGERWQAISANLLMVHGGAAMVTLMLFGAMVPIHLLRAWRAKRNRWTGGVMAVLNAILIITAFGLYYLGGEEVRPWMSNIHLGAGFSLPLLLFIHILRGRGARPRARLPSG